MMIRKILNLVALMFVVKSDYLSCLAQHEHEEDDARCLGWAEAGECDANPTYMWEYCRYQCELVEKHESSALKDIRTFFDLKAHDIDGNEVSFRDFHGHYTIVTNVASYCGYTASHYKQLVELYSKLKHTERVFILAFPCNQFGGQEPEDNASIKEFAQGKGVEFMMMDKVDVNGKDAHAVFKFLKKVSKIHRIQWNFNTYFVIDPHGNVDAHTGIEPLQLFEPLLNKIDKEL